MASAPPPPPSPLVFGVLALQGGFLEHVSHLRCLGLRAERVLSVRTPEQLARVDALVIPGGESTAIGNLAAQAGLLEPLREWVRARRPTWGTCAGLVMLAERAEGTKAGGQPLLGGLDATVSRNYFGAQLASFEAPLEVAEAEAAALRDAGDSAGAAAPPAFVGVFIRAPAILEHGAGVTPVAWVSRAAGGGARVLVAARVGDHLLATAFHPELTPSVGFHRLFAGMAARAAGRPLALESGGGGRLSGAGAGDGVSGAGPLQAGASVVDADIAARRVR
jgi:5'-phosphate synthase pdxT subunit